MTARAVVIAAGAHIFAAAHVPAIAAAGVEVVGVFDAAPARVEAVASAHGWPVAASLDDLLALDADFAVICAPHPLHADLARACMSAGKDVLVEKPVAGQPGEVDAILETAAATGRRVAVVHQHRFRDDVREAAKLVADGAIGRVHRADVTASYPKRSVYYTDTPWRGTWRGEGGGVILNQGLHDLDLLVHLLGMPSRVAAVFRTAVQPIETEDAADLLLQWPGGATGAVHITSAAALDGNRIEIHGSAGALRLSNRGLEVRVATEDFDAFARESGGHFDAFEMTDWMLATPPGGGGHADVYADVLTAWASGDEPAVSARAARDAVELIAGAVLADSSESWVSFPIDPFAYGELIDARVAAAAHESKKLRV